MYDKNKLIVKPNSKSQLPKSLLQFGHKKVFPLIFEFWQIWEEKYYFMSLTAWHYQAQVYNL